MAVITASLILSATLMILFGATCMVWLLSDKPLVQVTVQVANVPGQGWPGRVVPMRGGM